MIRGILLDVEGTTTPISFVYDVLFPYARRYMADYVRQGDLSDLRLEYEQDVQAAAHPPEWTSDPLPYIHWLMDHDRKSTALKRIQGEIWQEGFNKGDIQGEVFDDVPPAFERWRASGMDIRIFSSGSVLAQRLLFSTTRDGDLTRHLNGYFDTTIGPKQSPESYSRIAAKFSLSPADIVFVSDVVRELDAARDAGCQTLLCIRPGNHPQPQNSHRVVESFDAL